MRILLIGEYSNVHATLAQGLRQQGHQVTVVSNGDFWKNYPRDIDVSRRPGKLGGIWLWLKVMALLPRLKGYDVVQLINPMFLELKAERLFPIYKRLRKQNGKMILGAFGMDWYWVHTCTYEKPLRYSDFNIGDTVRTDPCALREQKDWLGTKKMELNQWIANDCDGIVAGLYEYYVCYQKAFPSKTTFIPFPITRPEMTRNNGIPEKLNVFIGINRSRNQYKGTDIMLRAAKRVMKAYPDRMSLILCESVPFEEYQRLMDGSDVILDQLYSYTPSMNALLAMSKGIICIGGGEEESYEIIHEETLRPIINVTPNEESVYQALEALILHPERVPELRRQSMEYVKKHHETAKIAVAYLAVYQ